MGVHTLREIKNGAKRAEGMLLEGISGAPKERRDKRGNARNVPEHPVSTQRPLGPLFPESGPPACPATRRECCSTASPLVRGKYGKKGTIEGKSTETRCSIEGPRLEIADVTCRGRSMPKVEANADPPLLWLSASLFPG
jgi:hypothetical protein